MAVKKRQVTVQGLCEDSRHRQFIYAYLVRRGFAPGKIRNDPQPRGRGSAEQFVREKYPERLRNYRRYCAINRSATCALIVMIDADTGDVMDRIADFQAMLREQGVDQRDDQEPVCILIPKRHIETWAYHLLDTSLPVDESTDYKPKIRDSSQLIKADENLVGFCPEGEKSPPSLVRGCEELRRLPG